MKGSRPAGRGYKIGVRGGVSGCIELDGPRLPVLAEIQIDVDGILVGLAGNRHVHRQG